MDIRNLIRPIIAGLVGLGVIVLVIVLLVKAFSGGGSSTAKQIDVGTYANTAASATLLIDAPTNVDQDHRQVKITVSQNENEIDIYQGYQSTIMSTRTYPSNSAAFGAFLQSLKIANFSKGSTDKSLADYRGYCPTGDRYVFTFNNGQANLFNYWATNCGSQGTYKGNRDTTLSLFEAQIPQADFNQLTNGVTLGFGF